MTLAAVLHRMARAGNAPATTDEKGRTIAAITPHGTARSTSRDWAGEATHHARDVCEFALAHKVGDKTERSYRRRTAFDKRRLLMADWASYLEKSAAGVVDLAEKRAEAAARAGAA
jgi:hypothetical protein